MNWNKMAAVAVSILLTTSIAYSVDEEEFSGFLTSYERLEIVPGEMVSYIYIAPGAFEKSGTYIGLMIDQPEIFISEDSKYKGIKPADVTLIAEMFRDAFAAELSNLYEIVHEPGENVMHMRAAITNLDLKKKKRRLLAYTPAGVVVHAGVNLQKSVIGKTNMRGAVIEVEMLDSQSGEILAQIIDVRARSQPTDEQVEVDEKIKWELFIKMTHTYASRMACRIRNVRLPEQERVVCPHKTIEDLIAEIEGEG